MTMTPLSFEWKWTVDYFIFMGFLYLAIVILGCGLAVAYIKSWLEIDREENKTPDISSRSKYSEY